MQGEEQQKENKPFPFLFLCGFVFVLESKMEGGGDAKSPPGAAPRGPPGAASGGAATTRQVGQQHALDAYNKRLDSAVAKLNEHYANILKSAKVHTARFLKRPQPRVTRACCCHCLEHSGTNHFDGTRSETR